MLNLILNLLCTIFHINLIQLATRTIRFFINDIVLKLITGILVPYSHDIFNSIVFYVSTFLI